MPKKGHWFAYRKATSNTDARLAEDTLINTHGTDGGTGGGDYNSNYVYSYKKTSITNP